MDFETVDAAAFGRSMKGIGLNILVRDVRQEAAFLTPVFDMAAHRLSANTGCNGRPRRPQSAPIGPVISNVTPPHRQEPA